MNDKQKLRKKKKREVIAKERVLKRREEIREEAKKIVQDHEREKALYFLDHGVRKPFTKDGKPRGMSQEQIKTKLEKNLALLKAMEEEFDKQQNDRKKLNEELEEEGHFSLEDKMNALKQRAMTADADSALPTKPTAEECQKKMNEDFQADLHEMEDKALLEEVKKNIQSSSE